MLIRRRMMLGANNQNLPVMNPSFEYIDGYIIQRTIGKPYLQEKAGFAATDFIYVGNTGSVVIFKPLSAKIAANTVVGSLNIYRAVNDNFTDWWNNYLNGRETTYALSANKRYIRFGFDPDTMADMYAYNSTTGQVYYAGINTPYYGKTNIND